MGEERYRRRTVLAGLGTALAGCSGDGSERTATGTLTAMRTTSSAMESPTETATATETATETTTREPAEVREWAERYYQGPMISAHEHMSGPTGYQVADGDLPDYVEWMDRNRVVQAMAIASDHHMDSVARHDDRLIPFAFGWTSFRNHFEDLSAHFRERLETYPAYDGIGEIGLKGQLTPEGEPPVPADHPNLMATYALAGEMDVPVMVHIVGPWGYPGDDWEEPAAFPPFQQLDRAMAQHRETDFLVHQSYFWPEMTTGELVARKFEDHPNLYYDISPTAPKLMFGEGSFTEAEFEEAMGDDGIEAEIERLYSRHAAALETHSDRMLWGIDASNEWHYEDWALDTFLDIARGILGRLPEENARNVAYRTAEDLFDVEVPDAKA